MRNSIGLQLKQNQKLNPQQIQLVSLLQIPNYELAARIEEELEINPALEENLDSETFKSETTVEDLAQKEMDDFDTYLENDYAGYKVAGDLSDPNQSFSEKPIRAIPSTEEFLMMQMNFVIDDEIEKIIAEQIIGSLDDDGYLRRDLYSIVNDLAFNIGLDVSEELVFEVLKKVQSLDPPGIGARNLQECILIQLERKNPEDKIGELAIQTIRDYFEPFSRKDFNFLLNKLSVEEDELKLILNEIKKCNPKPGGSSDESFEVPYSQVDFIVLNSNGNLDIQLTKGNIPELKISKDFQEMLNSYKNEKEGEQALKFIKEKIDSAQSFISAIQQRQTTMLKTMWAIVEKQKAFFLDQDDSNLIPLKMQEIADIIQMDISTVSRVVSGKSVQTNEGIFPLKFFFNEAAKGDSKENLTTREVRNILKQIIEEEDKANPYSDEKLEEILSEKGFEVKRRTIAKYREILEIPIAKLRKEL
jgi:RNA polymerase sigma-54 factor